MKLRRNTITAILSDIARDTDKVTAFLELADLWELRETIESTTGPAAIAVDNQIYEVESEILNGLPDYDVDSDLDEELREYEKITPRNARLKIRAQLAKNRGEVRQSSPPTTEDRIRWRNELAQGMGIYRPEVLRQLQRREITGSCRDETKEVRS